MKKSKLSLGLIACLLSVGSLAGCDPVKSSDDGVLLSYTVDGKKNKIFADDILKEYYDDSSKYQSIFDAIFKVVKINYFSKDRDKVNFNGVTVTLGKPQMTKINADADRKVDVDKQTAQDNAEANGTRYKKEFEAILKEKGVKTEEELHAKYVEELQEETFNENFYTYFVDEMRGDKGTISIPLSNGKTFKWNGYLNDQSPYHMSHLLVQFSDAGDTNYSDGKLSKDDASNLWTVFNALQTHGDNYYFKNVAGTYSDDETSRAKSGDLGIMDYDTSFTSEFKLGIYAYEQLYLNRSAENRTIKISDDFKSKYQDQIKDLFNLSSKTDVPTVSYKVFEELRDYAETEDKEVLGGSELLLPRNIVYNKYLNRHAVFFIEGDAYDDTDPEEELDNGNFHSVELPDDSHKKVILCADDDPERPIVVVRGASGGLHFMVVNRSPLKTDYDVTDKDYYTTYYYQQEMYPHPKKDGVELDTYATFLSTEQEDSKSRAEEVASKLKSYDSDKLNKYIFLKFAKQEKLTFTKDCKEIEKALMNWILTSAEKKSDDDQQNWKKTWNEYIDKLSRQNAERNKLIPQACKVAYAYANDSSKVLNSVVPFASLDADEIELIKHNGLRVMDGINSSGVIVPGDKNGKVDDIEIEYYWTKVELPKTFKTLGGVCNDGEEHI